MAQQSVDDGLAGREVSARILGRYRPIAFLARGGMASVYLTVAAGPSGFRKLLVAKELRSHLAEDPKLQQMFLDEARVSALLSHPNVVQTYDFGNDGKRQFIIMEYVEGKPLHEVVAKKLPLTHLTRILSEALDGLQYAHELTDASGEPLNIVHRDISPHNILVTREGSAKILDFGIAKVAINTRTTATETGTIKGKIGYMAPEQIYGEALDRRADVFAVGVVLWEGLTGQRLTKGDSDMVAMHKRMNGAIPKVADLAPNAPAELVRICERAIATSPGDRFATAREFQLALERYHDLAPENRCGKDDISTFMRGAFDEEWKALRKQIDQALKQADESPDFRPDLSSSIPILRPSDGTPSSAATALGTGTTRRHVTVSTKRGAQRARMAAFGFVGAAAFAGIGALSLRSGHHEVSHASAAPSAPAVDNQELDARAVPAASAMQPPVSPPASAASTDTREATGPDAGRGGTTETKRPPTPQRPHTASSPAPPTSGTARPSTATPAQGIDEANPYLHQ